MSDTLNFVLAQPNHAADRIDTMETMLQAMADGRIVMLARIEALEAEIDRLQAAKRRALALADEYGKELAALRLAPEQKPLTVDTIDPANPMPDDPPVQQQPNSAVFPGFRGNNEA